MFKKKKEISSTNQARNNIKEYNFNEAYMILTQNDYVWGLNNLYRDFPNIESQNMFCFIIYVLSKKCTPEVIIMFCQFLEFSESFFYDYYSIINFWLRLGLERYPNNELMLSWIVDYFSGHPDSPFSDEELNNYRNILKI